MNNSNENKNITPSRQTSDNTENDKTKQSRAVPRPTSSSIRERGSDEFVLPDADEQTEVKSPATPTLVSGVLKAAVYLTVVVVVSLFLAIGIIVVGNDVFALVKDDSIVEVTIPENCTVEQMADILHENGIINYPAVFLAYAKLKDVSAEDIVAGTYSLSAMMNYDRLCMAFMPVFERKIVRLTIPEGSNVFDIIRIFTEAGIGTEEGFIEAINTFDYSEYFEFIKEVNEADTEARIYRLEGYLYPDTYDFYSDSKETQIIYKLLENFDSKFSKEMKEDAAEAGFTMDQIITIASIVQKETYYYEDYEYVASVFVNRLSDPKNYPKLESDATTAYAVELLTGKRPENIGEQELKTDSPYNTRIYEGYPPGAICNPGYEAIMCAIYPISSDYYYFVTDNDGYNIFSKTYAQHLKAVAAVEAGKTKEDLSDGND